MATVEDLFAEKYSNLLRLLKEFLILPAEADDVNKARETIAMLVMGVQASESPLKSLIVNRTSLSSTASFGEFRAAIAQHPSFGLMIKQIDEIHATFKAKVPADKHAEVENKLVRYCGFFYNLFKK